MSSSATITTMSNHKKVQKMEISISTEERKNKDNMMRVDLRITTDCGERFRISTGIFCKYKPKGMVCTKREPFGDTKTAALTRIYSIAYKFMLENAGLDAEGAREGLEVALGRKKVYKPASNTIADCFERFIETKPNESTKGIYAGTLKNILLFDPKATLETVDIEWLKRYEQWFNSNHKINGTAKEMRNIRAVFNHAIDEGLTQNYPFRRFRIKHEQTSKRNLTVSQLRILRDYPCEDFQTEYRDLFFLMLYLRGINMVDLLHLTKDNIVGDHIEYVRRKTDKENAVTRKKISVRIEPEAQEIFNRYKGRRFLLKPLDRYKDYHDYTHHMNNVLKTIGMTFRNGVKKTGEPLFPELSSYWSRHSWASIASECDVSIDTIAYALGHSTGFKVTEIYVNYNQRKVDEANRRVIDYLNADLRQVNKLIDSQGMVSGWGYDATPSYYITT